MCNNVENFERRHSVGLTQVFNNKAEMDAQLAGEEKYRALFVEAVGELLGTDLNGAFVRGCFGTFCPEVQFVTIDALDKKDWPHNITENSVYVTFKIDFARGTFEAWQYGHIYLTEHDRKASYLCMCSMKQAHIANGGKWMRKSRFADASELARKIQKFWLSVSKTLDEVTDGYPYKQMTVDIY